ncbi:hypothetical protein [Brumimicrobium glaciale]|nr:hypothetical protein [Brumimicrobium glaciale]
MKNSEQDKENNRLSIFDLIRNFNFWMYVVLGIGILVYKCTSE